MARRPSRIPYRPWTADELETVRINFADWPTFLIAYLVNRTDQAVHNMAHKMGLSKSEKFKNGPYAGRLNPEHPKAKAHRFPKGHVPANKGLRRPGWSAGRMRETQFKKGVKPQTWKPIGTRARDRDGYWKEKVRDDAPPGMSRFNWVYLHVALWEEHLGSVPPGHCIKFKNGNQNDIRIDNLACISQRQNMRNNSYHTRYPKEVGLAIQAKAVLTRAINRATREQRHE